MGIVGAVAWALSLFALFAGLIANPLVAVAMAVLYGSIYAIGRFLTRKRDEREPRREKWTGL